MTTHSWTRVLILWEHAAQYEQIAQLNPVRCIDVEDVSRGAPARRQADKPRALPGKVTAPALPTGIVQHNDAAGDNVAAAQIAGFSQVAFEARPGQVTRFVRAVVLPGDDVFNVELKERLIGFVQAAIFAALAGSTTDQPPNRRFHADCPLRARRMRARALRMAMKWFARR